MATKSLIDMILWELYKEEATKGKNKKNKKWKDLNRRYEKESFKRT